MRKMENMNERMKPFVYILAFLFLVELAYAIPVPHGISGYIYELDGVTPVSDGIDFSVHDMTIGEFIQGKIKNNGRYAVSLNGANGDVIVVRAWTKYNSVNRTVNLAGVMRGVDLLLNTSVPEFPPNITSVPITDAIEDTLYTYNVTAEDENMDILTFALLVSPNGMDIDPDTGLIGWLPTEEDIGDNNVTVQVSDGIFNVTQSFVVNVTGQSNGGEGGGSRGILSVEETEDVGKEEAISRSFEKLSSVVEKINLDGIGNEEVQLKVKDLTRKPDHVRALNRKVYRYLDISSEEEIKVESLSIQFKVEREWLDMYKAEIMDVILNGYVNNRWEEIPTTHIGAEGDYENYEAKIYDLDYSANYFSVSLKVSADPSDIITSGPREPHVISGIIFRDDNKQVEQGTEFIVTNKNTKENLEGKTGFKQNSGGYYVIVNGNNGDEVDIEVQSGFRYVKNTIILKGDMRGVDLRLSDGGFSPITGYSVGFAGFSYNQGVLTLVSLMLLVISVIYLKKYSRRGIQSFKKRGKNG